LHAIRAQAPSQQDIEQAALDANAHGFICALPMAYDTPVTDKCATIAPDR